MQAHTKKPPTDELVTVTLRVRRTNVPLLRRYAETLENDEQRSYTVAEVFPEYVARNRRSPCAPTATAKGSPRNSSPN